VVPVTNACKMLDILVDDQNRPSARLQQRGVECNSYVFLRTWFSSERRRLTQRGS
jgi:hypothetical protein